MYVLREIDNKLYVLALYTRQDEPVVVRMWYPTGIVASVARRNLGVDRLDGLRLKITSGSGTYMIQDPGVGPVVVQLEHGGQTTAEDRDEVYVLPPKTRRRGKISWNRGEWMIVGKQGWETLVTEDEIITREIQMAPPVEV